MRERYKTELLFEDFKKKCQHIKNPHKFDKKWEKKIPLNYLPQEKKTIWELRDDYLSALQDLNYLINDTDLNPDYRMKIFDMIDVLLSMDIVFLYADYMNKSVEQIQTIPKSFINSMKKNYYTKTFYDIKNG